MTIKAPKWLVPSEDDIVSLPTAHIRSVLTDEEARKESLLAAKRRRWRKWRASAKGIAWYAANAEKIAANRRTRYAREANTKQHRKWREANRERYRVYRQNHYYANHEKRRTYLNEKQRQYRAARKAARQAA